MELASGRALACRRLAIITLFVFMAPALPSAAQSLADAVQIHGFGGWAYAETDGNYYTIGTEDGSWDNGDFALNVSAEPIENLSIVAQIRGEAVNGDDNFELDYAFAGWSFSDALELRIGRVKHPFGVYGEIIDVGVLRPFHNLAQSVYGPVGLTARAYNGVGLGGWYDWDSGWGLQYDVYYGQIEGDYETPGFLLTDLPEYALDPRVDLGFSVTDTIGGRLVVHAPVAGLEVGVSGYVGDDRTVLEGDDSRRDKEVWLASVNYLTSRWLIRAEYGTFSLKPSAEGTVGYVEAAFKITDKWQVAARYDTFDADLLDVPAESLPPYFSQLLEHEDTTLGLNYWFSSNFVVRLSYSMVDGNRFAFVSTSEEVLEMFATGELESRTDMVLFGAQFSF